MLQHCELNSRDRRSKDVSAKHSDALDHVDPGVSYVGVRKEASMSLAIATKIASSNDDYVKWPFGCVVTKGGAVQAIGRNILKSDPAFVDDHTKCSVHAEVDALRQMGFRAHGCVMFIARVTKTGRKALAKPCTRCQRVITNAGVKRVVFTLDESGYGVWKP